MSLDKLRDKLFTNKEVEKEYIKLKPLYDKAVKKIKQQRNVT